MNDLDIVMLNRKEVGNPQCCHRGEMQIIKRPADQTEFSTTDEGSLICLSRQNLGPFGKIETFSGLLFLLYRTCSQLVHFNHLKSVLTLIPLWQQYMLDYFDKNYNEYEAGFESRGDFKSQKPNLNILKVSDVFCLSQKMSTSSQ